VALRWLASLVSSVVPAPRGADDGPADLWAEAAWGARLLRVRSRREAAGPFAGAWSSAFRGSGIEFEESRPYVPGDDVRSIDWNATARAGEPFVKRFREERDQTVVVLLDLSGSMAFGSGESTKAGTATRAAALVAAAAGHAGDRVGLLAFDARVRAEVPPGRGAAHTTAVVREASRAGARPAAGATDVAAALERASRLARRHAVLFLLSDLRDDALFGGPGRGGAALAAAGRRHDLVAAVVSDPLEERLPAVGAVRVVDPERPGAPLVLGSGPSRARELYAAAAAVRRRALGKRLRDAGADVLHLSTRDDPLRVLGRFFRQRAGRARGVALS